MVGRNSSSPCLRDKLFTKAMNTEDTLFADPLGRIKDFSFDKKVAAVFPDMIERSVPGYRTIIHMTGTLAAQFVQDDSHCYDLGCSLGAAMVAMHHNLKGRACHIIGVDSSKAMLEKCRPHLQLCAEKPDWDLICANILDVEISNASVVVLNYTLQFIAPALRNRVLEKIYAGMRPGGILVLSEKVAFDDARMHKMYIELHHRFKKANGYSDLEISQKRTALENVLLPETIPAHTERLRKAGFESCEVWFQCFNFISILAIK